MQSRQVLANMEETGYSLLKKYGPRVRLGKIYTNLDLSHDKQIHFGVKEFCNICNLCASSCPVKAIPYDAPSDITYNKSNISGVRKWSVDGEKCFSFWTAQNSDCSICIRVCPYNKDYSKLINRIGIRLAGTWLRNLLLWIDIKLSYGKRKKSSKWWSTK